MPSGGREGRTFVDAADVPMARPALRRRGSWYFRYLRPVVTDRHIVSRRFDVEGESGEIRQANVGFCHTAKVTV